jgi:hypothetical protein
MGVFVGQGVGVNDAAELGVERNITRNDAADAGEMLGTSGGVTADSARRIPAIAVQRIANNKANKNNGLTNMMSL